MVAPKFKHLKEDSNCHVLNMHKNVEKINQKWKSKLQKHGKLDVYELMKEAVAS